MCSLNLPYVFHQGRNFTHRSVLPRLGPMNAVANGPCSRGTQGLHACVFAAWRPPARRSVPTPCHSTAAARYHLPISAPSSSRCLYGKADRTGPRNLHNDVGADPAGTPQRWSWADDWISANEQPHHRPSGFVPRPVCHPHRPPRGSVRRPARRFRHREQTSSSQSCGTCSTDQDQRTRLDVWACHVLRRSACRNGPSHRCSRSSRTRSDYAVRSRTSVWWGSRSDVQGETQGDSLAELQRQPVLEGTRGSS